MKFFLWVLHIQFVLTNTKKTEVDRYLEGILRFEEFI